ncbi:MAG: amino acid adenylation domain-containing protein [Acidobacteria bacterium]|nr:MAG: amino acid adenylation domain-containing protein [Acidobacteriota bacterium]REK08748.1 MAG: amino acid adenylation domain-containing protein [Acidobacteriota bacterium]
MTPPDENASPAGPDSHPQKQIWLGQRRSPDSPLYNMAFALWIEGELDAERLRRAWRAVVRDQPVLRSHVLPGDNGDPRFGTLPDSSCELEIRTLRDQSDPPAAARALCLQRCAAALPPGGELVDSLLLELGDGASVWYLNLHHLITDAFSTRLLIRQVAAHYRRFGGESVEPQPLVPYGEALRTLAPQPGRAREQAEDHWRSRAAGQRATPLYGRGAVPGSGASSRYTLEIGGERQHRLDELAAAPGWRSFSPDLSRFALLATLLAAWLHRVGGESRVGFDAPVGGRPTPAAKRSLGLFIEVFPFAAEVAAGDSFRQLGERCLREAQSLLRHALPGTSRPSRSTSGNVVLNYFPDAFGDQDSGDGRFAGLPLEVEWLHPGASDAVHALRLQVHDFSGRGQWTLHFDCNDELLPPPLARRAVAHFERLLDACIADPNASIGGVTLLSSEEQAVLAAFDRSQPGAPGVSPLPGATVLERFVQRAAADPDRVALRQGGRTLSFAALERASATVALQLLTGDGVGREQPVAVSAGRSIETVVALLGVLRAGAAWVPVDPRHPAARVAGVVGDSGARLLLHPDHAPPTEELLEALPVDVVIRPVSVPSDEPGTEPDRARLPTVELSQLAYLLYTSGSTGAPKGVPIEHRGLASYIDWAEARYVRGDRLTFPLFTSLTFDLTLTSLFLPLVSGGTLDIHPETDAAVDAALVDVVAANRADFVKLTPSHLSLLRRLDLRGSRLRRMVVGGEDLHSHLAHAVHAAFAEQGAELEIDNEYGPTEAVVGCSVHRYDPATDDAGSSVPIGLPADHVALSVRSPVGEPVPVGTPGELWIRRHGLARGYRGLEQLSAERFVEDPEHPGKRWYLSGDLVRVAEHGGTEGDAAAPRLEFLGRVDRQLKISGMRVEPGDVEAALASHPAISQAVVLAHGGAGRAARTDAASLRFCVRCGLPSNHPRARFDEDGVCNLCRAYDEVEERAQAYFRSRHELRALFAARRDATADADTAGVEGQPGYDCMMLLSGGKDSTYALCQLVEMGLRVYAFTLDNGFISEGAKRNMRRVTEQLGVPLEMATTAAMNEIFRDSLRRFSNVCHGCFKTIYTLSLRRAHELGIGVVVTGLSRGQMFETRLTEELFRDGRFSPEEVDAAVLAARKVYHRVDDAVARRLDVELFRHDEIFEQIEIVDFYRYWDVGLDEVLGYLEEKVPWVRPEDTGRSTNCLINDVGIWVHRRERDFHNYALPYSWDVRMGHKTRQQALDELHDEIDEDHVRRTLLEIGMPELLDDSARDASGERRTLAGFYVAAGELADADLRSHLEGLLPAPLVPAMLRRVEAIPLTAHGKVDEAALLATLGAETRGRPQVAPRGEVEEYLAAVWSQELEIDAVGAEADFFALGGTSLGAVEVMVRLCREFDIELPLESLFEHPTLRELAALAEQRILDDVAGLSEAEQQALLDGSPTDEIGEIGSG